MVCLKISKNGEQRDSSGEKEVTSKNVPAPTIYQFL